MSSTSRFLALMGFLLHAFHASLALAKVALGVGALIAMASAMVILSILCLAARQLWACLRELPSKMASFGEMLRRLWRYLESSARRARGDDLPVVLVQALPPLAPSAPLASESSSSSSATKKPACLYAGGPAKPQSLSQQLADFHWQSTGCRRNRFRILRGPAKAQAPLPPAGLRSARGPLLGGNLSSGSGGRWITIRRPRTSLRFDGPIRSGNWPPFVAPQPAPTTAPAQLAPPLPADNYSDVVLLPPVPLGAGMVEMCPPSPELAAAVLAAPVPVAAPAVAAPAVAAPAPSYQPPVQVQLPVQFTAYRELAEYDADRATSPEPESPVHDDLVAPRPDVVDIRQGVARLHLTAPHPAPIVPAPAPAAMSLPPSTAHVQQQPMATIVLGPTVQSVVAAAPSAPQVVLPPPPPPPPAPAPAPVQVAPAAQAPVPPPVVFAAAAAGPSSTAPGPVVASTSPADAAPVAGPSQQAPAANNEGGVIARAIAPLSKRSLARARSARAQLAVAAPGPVVAPVPAPAASMSPADAAASTTAPSSGALFTNGGGEVARAIKSLPKRSSARVMNRTTAPAPAAPAPVPAAAVPAPAPAPTAPAVEMRTAAMKPISRLDNVDANATASGVNKSRGGSSKPAGGQSALRQHLAKEFDAETLEDLDAEIAFAPMPTSADNDKYKLVLQAAQEQVAAADAAEAAAETIVPGQAGPAVHAAHAPAPAVAANDDESDVSDEDEPEFSHSDVMRRFDAITKEVAKILRDAGIGDVADAWEGLVRAEFATNHEIIADIDYPGDDSPTFTAKNLREVGSLTVDANLWADEMVPPSMSDELEKAFREAVRKHLLDVV